MKPALTAAKSILTTYGRKRRDEVTLPFDTAAAAIVCRGIHDKNGAIVIAGDNLASIGASTVALTGAIAVNDVTTPSVTLTNGSTNTGFFWVKGKTSGGTKYTTADATAYTVTVSTAAQTVGTATFTLADAANVAQTFLTMATSSGNIDFSGSGGTFKTPTGAHTLGGAVSIADATTPSLTTASGKTNTGFVTINGKTSGGIKFTTADATAFLVTATLSAQTSGTAALTIPDFAGVADEFCFKTKSLTLSNKTFVAPVLGAATGTSLVLTAGVRFTPTVYTSDGAITLASGTHLIEKTSAAAMTVAAPSSQDGERLEIISNTDFAHVVTFSGSTLLDGTTGANLTVTLTAFKGSGIVVEARGTKWLLVSSSNVTSITV